MYLNFKRQKKLFTDKNSRTIYSEDVYFDSIGIRLENVTLFSYNKLSRGSSSTKCV